MAPLWSTPPLYDTFALSFYILHPPPLPPGACFETLFFSLQLNYMAKPVVSAEG